MGEIRILKEEIYDEETGSILDVKIIDSIPPNGGNGTPSPGVEVWKSFIPGWRVGSSGGLYATPGSGYIQGWYKEKDADLFIGDNLFGSVKEIDLFVELKAISPNIPSGEGFEIELPEGLRPPSTDSARGGGGELWILGGENSHSISPKFTDRNQRSMRIIIIGSGWEWTTTVPKVIPVSGEKTCDLHFWMKYLR
jgi:hypothetical protein